MAGFAGSVAIAAEQRPKSRGMTLGFSTYGTKSLKTEQALNLLSEVGYDSVELTVWPGWDADSATMPGTRRKAIRKQLQNCGLNLTSLMEHLHIDEKDRTREARIERVKLAAALAHDLSRDSPPLMQTTIGGGGDWKQMRSHYADEIQDWLKVADSNDLVIAVKPHRGGAFSRPDEAVELIELLGKPERLRMCYDYAHYDFRDMTLEETISTALPYIAHVAVKDVVDRNGRKRFVLAGEGGRVDYSTMLEQLHNGGYQGDICSEVSGQVWSQKGYVPAEAANKCYSHLAAAFEKSAVPRRS